jgi:hypothetical protein
MVQRRLPADAGNNSQGGKGNATACAAALFIQTG